MPSLFLLCSFLLQQRLTGTAGADAAEQEGEGMRPPELGNFAMKVGATELPNPAVGRLGPR